MVQLETIITERMGPFSEGELVKRLNELRDSQKEIQNVSAWIVHHRCVNKTVGKFRYTR